MDGEDFAEYDIDLWVFVSVPLLERGEKEQGRLELRRSRGKQRKAERMGKLTVPIGGFPGNSITLSNWHSNLTGDSLTNDTGIFSASSFWRFAWVNSSSMGSNC